MIGRVEEESERHLEGLGHFARIGSQLDRQRDAPHHGRDPVAGSGTVIGQVAEHIHAFGCQTDLLPGFAQGGRLR